MMTEEQKKMKGFSAGEKDLYREVGKIAKARHAENEEEKKKTAAYFAKKSYEG